MWERIIRVVRHRWVGEASHVVGPDMLKRLTEQVTKSERLHSGEVRICIEGALPNSYLVRTGSMRSITRQRALSQFGKLRVWDTENNNGVLIYVLLAERAIELVADRGLNRLVAPNDWQAMVQSLGRAIHNGHLEAGLNQAIDAVSAVLVQHFPYQAGSIRPNELPDQPNVR